MLSHNYSLYIKRSVSARKHQRFSVNAKSDIVAVATVTTVPKGIGTVGTWRRMGVSWDGGTGFSGAAEELGGEDEGAGGGGGYDAAA